MENKPNPFSSSEWIFAGTWPAMASSNAQNNDEVMLENGTRYVHLENIYNSLIYRENGNRNDSGNSMKINGNPKSDDSESHDISNETARSRSGNVSELSTSLHSSSSSSSLPSQYCMSPEFFSSACFAYSPFSSSLCSMNSCATLNPSIISNTQQLSEPHSTFHAFAPSVYVGHANSHFSSDQTIAPPWSSVYGSIGSTDVSFSNTSSSYSSHSPCVSSAPAASLSSTSTLSSFSDAVPLSSFTSSAASLSSFPSSAGSLCAVSDLASFPSSAASLCAVSDVASFPSTAASSCSFSSASSSCSLSSSSSSLCPSSIGTSTISNSLCRLSGGGDMIYRFGEMRAFFLSEFSSLFEDAFKYVATHNVRSPSMIEHFLEYGEKLQRNLFRVAESILSDSSGNVCEEEISNTITSSTSSFSLISSLIGESSFATYPLTPHSDIQRERQRREEITSSLIHVQREVASLSEKLQSFWKMATEMRLFLKNNIEENKTRLSIDDRSLDKKTISSFDDRGLETTISSVDLNCISENDPIGVSIESYKDDNESGRRKRVLFADAEPSMMAMRCINTSSSSVSSFSVSSSSISSSISSSSISSSSVSSSESHKRLIVSLADVSDLSALESIDRTHNNRKRSRRVTSGGDLANANKSLNNDKAKAFMYLQKENRQYNLCNQDTTNINHNDCNDYNNYPNNNNKSNSNNNHDNDKYAQFNCNTEFLETFMLMQQVNRHTKIIADETQRMNQIANIFIYPR